MSSVVPSDGDALPQALKEAYQAVAEQGEVLMVITLSRAFPVLGT